ncbi:50S ribosome-binding GTPase [Arcanobacterium haemolyticum]|nr:50S ribosome-binding GTPase [Arcanobacterium haemolyticum]
MSENAHEPMTPETAVTSARQGTRLVNERLEALRDAINAGGDYFDPFLVARAREELQQAEQRLHAGAGLTVAALAGGTGSGKSSLFNAISSLDFAEVGELRPTTHEPSACIWSADADEILDVLGVKPDRRIHYDSILTPDDGTLESLVLLDLPDHDSVDATHSASVSSILPKVDLLIWVLDPQKYADHLIHESYLSAMRQRRDHMIIVLNQIDLVPGNGRDILVKDIRRLLEEDGLGQVPLYAVSANNRASLVPLREELARAVRSTHAATATAIAQLDAIRSRLAKGIGPGEADMEPLAQRATADIVEAAAIPAVADSIREAGRRLGGVAHAKPEMPATTLVTATCDSWNAQACGGLPPLWRAAVQEALPHPDSLRRTIGSAVRSVEIPKVSLAVLVVAVLVALALVGGATAGFVLGSGAGIALGIVGLVCAGAVLVGGVWLRRRKAASLGARYRDSATMAVRSVIDEQLVGPTTKILSEHRRTRMALTE